MTNNPSFRCKAALYTALAGALLMFALLTFATSFGWEDLVHTHARSISEALNNAYLSYMGMNARIGEMSTYLLAASSSGEGAYQAQMIFYVVNPLFCLAAVLLTMRLGIGHWLRVEWASVIALIFAVLTFLGGKQEWFWFDGNMSWLYPCVAAMCFFVIWEGCFRGDFKVTGWKFLASLPLAVVVGMSNENTSIVSLLVFLGCGVCSIVRQRRFCITWQYAVVAVVIVISAMLFYLAPGRAVRSEKLAWELTFHNIVFNSLLSPINWLYTAIFYWREAIVLMTLVFVAYRRKVGLLDKRMACLILVLGLLWGVLTAAPSWGAPRSYAPLNLMLLAIMARLMYKIAGHTGMPSKDLLLIVSLRAVLTLTILVPLVVLSMAQYRVRCQLAEHADAAKARGETTLILHRGDLDVSPVMPRYFRIPGAIVAHDLAPSVPLETISEKEYADSPDFRHREWKALKCEYPSSGDEALNRGVAKRFGLDSIIYLL